MKKNIIKRQKGISTAFVIILASLLLVAVLYTVLLFFPDMLTVSKVSMRDRVTRSPKSNMYTFQSMVDTYAVDYGGLYPVSVDALYRAAQYPPNPEMAYWKDFSNTSTGKTGKGFSYQDEGDSQTPGIVSYQAIASRGEITAYRIYGYDEHGEKFRINGKVFILDNL